MKTNPDPRLRAAGLALMLIGFFEVILGLALLVR